MEKVLLGIHAAAIGLHYDAFVPTDVPISKLTTLIVNGITELTDGKYEPSGLELLSLQEPEYLFDPMLTLSDYQVRDGMQLFLI